METLEATVASKPEPILEKQEEKSEGIKRNDLGLEEKSNSGTVNVENTEAVERLSATCNSLQTQVEQLQSSLQGVITFMSSFKEVFICFLLFHIQQINRTIFSLRIHPTENDILRKQKKPLICCVTLLRTLAPPRYHQQCS